MKKNVLSKVVASSKDDCHFPSQNEGRLGSGNNWACGYRNGSLAEENILNSLRWQLEHADRVDTVLPILSLAGGTGKKNTRRIHSR